MPTRAVSPAAKKNLELFHRSAAAREIEDDPGTWTVIEWSWFPGPPMRVTLRDEEGAVIDFMMDTGGLWQLRREPIEAKVVVPSDLAG